ncbi:hypothetical protein BJ165DRAFT_1464694, partial [Panaeolus papilionaceus]
SVLAQICLLGHMCATQPVTHHLHTLFLITLFLYSHHGALASSSARGSFSLLLLLPTLRFLLNKNPFHTFTLRFTQVPQLTRLPSRSRWITEVCE